MIGDILKKAETWIGLLIAGAVFAVVIACGMAWISRGNELDAARQDMASRDATIASRDATIKSGEAKLRSALLATQIETKIQHDVRTVYLKAEAAKESSDAQVIPPCPAVDYQAVWRNFAINHNGLRSDPETGTQGGVSGNQAGDPPVLRGTLSSPSP